MQDRDVLTKFSSQRREARWEESRRTSVDRSPVQHLPVSDGMGNYILI